MIATTLSDKKNRRTPIGICSIDDLLGGGVPPGIIVDIFGRHGTGKTQILLQAATRFVMCGKEKKQQQQQQPQRVLYVDTAGTFRPERIVEISLSSGIMTDTKEKESYDSRNILDAISVAKIQSVSEQVKLIETLLRDGCPFDLIIIDSLTDLFSYEYSRYGDLREKSQKFFRYMRNLARLAVHHDVTIMTSNMVRVFDDSEIENMAAEVDLFAHVKVHLISETRPLTAKKQLYGYVSCVMCDDESNTIVASYDHNIKTEKDADTIFSYEISKSGVKTFGYDHTNNDS